MERLHIDASNEWEWYDAGDTVGSATDDQQDFSNQISGYSLNNTASAYSLNNPVLSRIDYR